MTHRPVFVGGVQDSETALQLQLRGANGVAVSLSKLRWIASAPTASMSEAQRIRQALDKVDLCLCLSGDLPIEAQLDESAELDPAYHFVDARDTWAEDAIARVRQLRPALIVGGLTLDHDDSPQALLETMTGHAATWKPFAFHITLTPSQRSVLSWFRDTAGEYEDDVTINDVAAISDSFRIFINADVDNEGRQWVEDRLPRLAGWFFWNGQPDQLAGTPVMASCQSIFDLLAAHP